MSDLKSIYQYISCRRLEHLEKMQEYLRQPSVSATGEGIRECAELLANYFRELGCQEVELVETPRHPGVWAFYDAGAPLTFAVYGMYDVQPVSGQNWHFDPFGAELTSHGQFPQVVIARGAYNSKGTFRLFLNALEAIIAVHGTLPVNLMFISEGEEEIGSPNFPFIVGRYAERLQQAEALLDIEASQNKEGKVIVKLGNKGIVYLELLVSGKKWGRGPTREPIHSSYKAVVDNPAWRLVHALSTLTTPDGNEVAIEGFYDHIAPPSRTDEMLIDQLTGVIDESIYADLWGVSRWVNDLQGREWIKNYLFASCLNIDGLEAGHSGPGTLTIVPHEARAKIDFRLVPNMQPDHIIQILRTHLDEHGYSDIEIKPLAAYNWNKTHPDALAVRAMLKVYQAQNISYEIWPQSAGSEPLYLFTHPPFCLPMVRVGLGHGARNHAPDEYLVVEGHGKVAGIEEIEKAFVDFMYCLSELTPTK